MAARELTDRLAGLDPPLRGLRLSVLAGALAGGVTIAQAGLLSRVVDLAFLARAGLASCAPLLLGLVALAGLRGGLQWAQETGSQRYATAVRRSARAECVRHLLKLGPAHAVWQRSGAVSATIMGGIDSLDAYFAQYLPQTALAAVVPALVLTGVSWADLISGLVLLVTFPLIPIFMWLIGSRARAQTRRQWVILARLSARFLDALQALPTLRAFGATGAEASILEAATERYRRITMGVLKLAFVSSLTLEALATLGTALVAVEVGLRLLYGHVSFGSAFLVLILTPEFYRPLRALAAAYHAGMAGREAVESVSRLLRESRSGIAGEATRSGRWHAAPSLSGAPTIRCQALRVQYATQNAPALDELSLDVGAGTTVALVGPSGAGKSTLIQVLLRFVEPLTGRVLVNERDLADWPADEWRRHVAWLPQVPRLWVSGGTLRENVLLARPEASASELDRAAEESSLSDVLRALPQGWETRLGERGARLSGGQAQRVALARAYLKGSALLLLDEPTAQLDAESEARISESLARLMRGRTVLMVAHRLTTLERVDRVAVVSSGRVVEQGTPDDLRTTGTVFPRLWAAWRGAS